jgi:hypothetical protein
MKKCLLLSVSLLVISGLSACGTTPVQPVQQSAPQVNALRASAPEASQPARLMETFKGFLGYHTKYGQTVPHAELMMEVKSFFFNSVYRLSQRSTLRYSLRYENSNDFAMGHVRFGRDGVLYFENYTTNGYNYLRLGTYQAYAPQASEGEPIQFQLDPNLKLKMSWPGINPMAKHDIQIWSKNPLPAVQKTPAELF